MKYFIDQEFIEGFNKPLLWPLWGKKRHFIDLISIGIVCEDGDSYYAISRNFNKNDADNWVKENVISKLPDRKVSMHDSPRRKEESLLWKYNNLITYEILEFFGCEWDGSTGRWVAPAGIEVYGYYADYDWVLLCSMFGRMIDLPKGFPMYCRDLKQTLDDKTMERMMDTENKYDGETRFETTSKIIKNHPNYPKQENEHNALADAKWNYELYKFILSL